MKKSQSFSTYILLQVLPVMLIVMTAIGGTAFWFVRSSLEAELVAKHGQISELAASQITNQLDNITRQGQSLAKNDLLINSLVDVFARENYLPEFFNSLSLGTRANASIFLTDYKGRAIASNREFGPWVDSLQDWVRLAVEENAPQEQLGLKGWQVAVPVLYGQFPEGALVISFDFEEFAKLFHLSTTDLMVLIVDANNNVLFSSDPGKIPMKVFWSADAHPDLFYESHPIQSREGIRILTVESRSTALATLTRMEWVLASVIGIMLLGGVFGIIRSVWVAAANMRRFTSSIKQVQGSKDLGTRIELSGPREIQDLADSFNKMMSALEATSTSKEYVDGIINSLYELLIVSDCQGNIRLLNPAGERFLAEQGLSRAVRLYQALGLIPGDLFLTPQRGEQNSIETVHSSQTGKDSIIVWEKSLVENNEGEPEAMVFVGHDVTKERKNEQVLMSARETAEAASRAKSDFLANMSHELRTPLNAIIGYSEILMEESQDQGNTEQLADIEKIHVSGIHLLRLINDILDISKIEAGKFKLVPTTFDLDNALEKVISTATPLMKKNGNTLHVEKNGNLGTIHADEMKLSQILLNLLSNGAKFTENGDVHFSISKEEAAIRCEIRDTGIGIPEEKIGELFDSFTQVDTSSTRKYEGTGLGLAISQHLCLMMGGEIKVESEVGKGTRFWFALPISMDVEKDHASTK